jgi:tRNA (adenine22-N1)-methyltransferase
MSLEERLLLTTTEVSPLCHADVGTDHALLPLYLLNNRICRRVIATEKSPSAFHVAKQRLWGRKAEVRQGEGLGPIEVDEVESLSLCGMGGHLVVEILSQEPAKVPPIVVVQANRDSHKVRQWAQDAGFHVVKEQMAKGHWTYEILTFHRNQGVDKAYENVPHELALHFGPLLLSQQHPLLLEELNRRREYHHEHPQNEELRRIKEALDLLHSQGDYRS